jgi:hypothetical protein
MLTLASARVWRRSVQVLVALAHRSRTGKPQNLRASIAVPRGGVEVVIALRAKRLRTTCYMFSYAGRALLLVFRGVFSGFENYSSLFLSVILSVLY